MRLPIAPVLALLLLPLSAGAVTIINNGLAPPNPANVIDVLIPEAVFVTTATTVALVDGGQVGDQGLERLEAFDTSVIQMSGGLVWDDIFAHDSATVLMTGGVVQSGVIAFGSSSVTIEGGTVSTGVFVDDFAEVFISGVLSPNLSGSHFGVATVTGGSSWLLMNAELSSTIRIVGGGFAVGGVPVGFGELPAIFGTAGTLTGVLQSGEALNTNFSRAVDGPLITGKIILVAPEPSLLALAALGMMLLAVRRVRMKLVILVAVALLPATENPTSGSSK